MYEIFPRNFSKEGDLNAITARLDELKDLGVDVLWLMPIHPIGEKMKKGSVGSPFAVRDFYAINPDYGTTNDFKRLIDEAHKRDMKLIMDIVAGQTAWDSVLMEHPDFYKKDTNGAIIAWLEALLNEAPVACVMVSHDRYFLENVATEIVELNRVYAEGLLRVKGTYSKFIEGKQAYLEAQSKLQDALKNRVKIEVEWLRRGPKARSTKAKARIDNAQDLIGQLRDVNLWTQTATTGIDFAGDGATDEAAGGIRGRVAEFWRGWE